MVWFLLGTAIVFGLAAALWWGCREAYRRTSAVRLERKLNPADVIEIDRAFARVQRDAFFGD